MNYYLCYTFNVIIIILNRCLYRIHECAASFVAGRWDVKQILCRYIYNELYLFEYKSCRGFFRDHVLLSLLFKNNVQIEAQTRSDGSLDYAHHFSDSVAERTYSPRTFYTRKVCYQHVFAINSRCLGKDYLPSSPPLVITASLFMVFGFAVRISHFPAQYVHHKLV